MRAVLAIAILTLFAGCKRAPPGELTAGDRAAIDELAASYQGAAQAGDWAGFTETFTPDGVYQIPEAPALVGHDQIMENARAFPAPTEMNLSLRDVDGSGKWAWARGNWMFEAPAMEGMPGMRMEGSVLWVLENQADGTWLIDTECYNLDHPGQVPGSAYSLFGVAAIQETAPLFEAYTAGMVTGDAPAIAALYTEDAVEMTAGSYRNRADIVAHYEEVIGSFDFPVWDFEPMDAWVHADAAYVVSRVNISQETEGGEVTPWELYSTMRLVKDDGAWKIHRNIVGPR